MYKAEYVAPSGFVYNCFLCHCNISRVSVYEDRDVINFLYHMHENSLWQEEEKEEEHAKRRTTETRA